MKWLILPLVTKFFSKFYLNILWEAAKEEGLCNFAHIVQELLCIWLSPYLHYTLQQIPLGSIIFRHFSESIFTVQHKYIVFTFDFSYYSFLQDKMNGF